MTASPASRLRTLPSADVDRLPNDPSTLCEIPEIVPAMNERASVAPARVTTLPERPFLPSASTKKPLIAWSTTAWLSKRSEEHKSELQSLIHNSYAAFCLIKKNILVKFTKTVNPNISYNYE